MGLGYDGQLFILAFDHRGSFKKGIFGISDREATDDERARISDTKLLIWEGFLRALDEGAPADAAGVLVDEEFGAEVARAAHERGVLFAMPVEASGLDVFDFEFGEEFSTHLLEFDPSFAKVLVRYNPDDDPGNKTLQIERLKQLGDWLHDHDRIFLFELLVPASEAQLARADGDSARYDTEVRPGVMIEAIRELQAGGVEPDIWKIEGIDRREDCEAIAQAIKADGRDGVVAVVLGRGADDAAVDHWLEQGAPVDGYVGFAIGRSIWNDAVKGYVGGTLDRSAAAASISESYRRFIDVYRKAEG